MRVRLSEHLTEKEFNSSAKQLTEILNKLNVLYYGQGDPHKFKYEKCPVISLNPYRDVEDGKDFVIVVNCEGQKRSVNLSDIVTLNTSMTSRRPMFVVPYRKYSDHPEEPQAQFWKFVADYKQSFKDKKIAMDQTEKSEIAELEQKIHTAENELAGKDYLFYPRNLEKLKLNNSGNVKAGLRNYLDDLTAKIKKIDDLQYAKDIKPIQKITDRLIELGISQELARQLNREGLALSNRLPQINQLYRFIALLTNRGYINPQSIQNITTLQELSEYVNEKLTEFNREHEREVDLSDFKDKFNHPNRINLNLSRDEEEELMQLLADEAAYLGGEAPLLQYSQCDELQDLNGYGPDIIKFVDNVQDADRKWGLSLRFKLKGNEENISRIQEIIDKIPAKVTARGTVLNCTDLALKAIRMYGFHLGANPGD